MGIFITQKSLEKTEEVQDIKDYIKHFDYNNFTKEEAELLLKYAENKYDKIIRDIEFLDNKSDLIIKYLGLGTGGFGVILGYFSLANCLPIIIPFLIGFIFWAISIGLSLCSSKPSAMPYPMTTKKIFNIIKNKEGYNTAVIKQALSYAYANIILKHIGIRKGRFLHWAYIGMVIAMSLFFLPLILRFI